MSAPKIERNIDLVQKRVNDPIKWTYEALGELYNMAIPSVHEVFTRDMEKYATPEQIESYLKISKK